MPASNSILNWEDEPQPKPDPINSFDVFAGTEKKFVEQVAPNYIKPEDEYEVWCVDAIQAKCWSEGTMLLSWDTIRDLLGSQIPMTRVIKILKSKSFYARMHSRGMNWPTNWTPETHENARRFSYLTPQQAAALAVVTDPTDRRALKTKLASVGITYNKWRTWLSDRNFADVLKDTSEKMLQDNIANVHTALTQKASAGDSNAMKLFYEVSGRHDPQRQQMLDFTKVLGLVLEVLQRHITDPSVLLAVTKDIDRVTSGKPLKEVTQMPANYEEEIIDAEVVEAPVDKPFEPPSVPPGFFDL